MMKQVSRSCKQPQSKLVSHFPRLSQLVGHSFRVKASATPPRVAAYIKDVLIGEEFEIGECSYCIGKPTVITSSERKLKIPKFCSIRAGDTILLGRNHQTNWVTTYPFRAFPKDWPKAEFSASAEADGTSKGDVVIGNDVWIAYAITILSGATIGDGAVIESKSLVTKDFEPYSIVGGNPARLIKKGLTNKQSANCWNSSGGIGASNKSRKTWELSAATTYQEYPNYDN